MVSVCPEDTYEPNDTTGQAKTLVLTGAHTVVQLASCATPVMNAWRPGPNPLALTGSSSGDMGSSTDTSSSSDTGSSSSAGDSSGAAPSSSGADSSSSSMAMAPACVLAAEVPASSSGAPGNLNHAVTLGDDWFRITIPAWSTFTARMDFTNAVSDLDLILTDAGGTLNLFSSTSVSDVETVRGPAEEATARDYLLLVTNYGKKDNTYALTVDIATRGGPPANDSCAQAEPLVVGTPVTGDTQNALSDFNPAIGSCGIYGAPAGDVFYSLDVAAGQSITATLQSDADLSLVLFEDCAAPCCWAGADRYSSFHTETLHFTNPTADILHLKLGVDGNGAGPFTLSLETP